MNSRKRVGQKLTECLKGFKEQDIRAIKARAELLMSSKNWVYRQETIASADSNADVRPLAIGVVHHVSH